MSNTTDPAGCARSPRWPCVLTAAAALIAGVAGGHFGPQALRDLRPASAPTVPTYDGPIQPVTSPLTTMVALVTVDAAKPAFLLDEALDAVFSSNEEASVSARLDELSAGRVSLTGEGFGPLAVASGAKTEASGTGRRPGTNGKGERR